MEKKSIKNFTDLIVWQKASNFAVAIYFLTNKFPKSEIYGLSSQLKRAVISISSNIAEGFSRSIEKDKNHFYLIAKSSLLEIESQILIAKKLGFLNNVDLGVLFNQKVELAKLLSGLIKSSQNKHTVY